MAPKMEPSGSSEASAMQRNHDEIFARVKEIIGASLSVPPSELSEGTRIIDDLNADSTDVIELVMCLEDEFDITIADKDAERLSTVGGTAKLIQERPV